MKALSKKNLLILGGLLLLYAAVLGLIITGIINPFYEITLALICINIILAVSLNLVTGFTGQFSWVMRIHVYRRYTCAIINMQMNSMAGFLIGLFAGAVLARL